jgi:hypothetical protein
VVQCTHHIWISLSQLHQNRRHALWASRILCFALLL